MVLIYIVLLVIFFGFIFSLFQAFIETCLTLLVHSGRKLAHEYGMKCIGENITSLKI